MSDEDLKRCLDNGRTLDLYEEARRARKEEAGWRESCHRIANVDMHLADDNERLRVRIAELEEAIRRARDDWQRQRALRRRLHLLRDEFNTLLEEARTLRTRQERCLICSGKGAQS